MARCSDNLISYSLKYSHSCMSMLVQYSTCTSSMDVVNVVKNPFFREYLLCRGHCSMCLRKTVLDLLSKYTIYILAYAYKNNMTKYNKHLYKAYVILWW